MWLFGKKPKQTGHTITDNDREASAETRKLKAEIRQMGLKRQRLEAEMELEEQHAMFKDLKDELYGEEEGEREGDSADSMIIKLLTPLLSGLVSSPKGKGELSSSPNQTMTLPSPNPNSITLSDAELNDIKERIPKKYIKMSKNFSDEQVRMFIKGQMPSVNEDTITRAVILLRGSE